MRGHRRILSKIKPCLFTWCFNRANDRVKFDYWGGTKPYCSSVSMVWWHGCRAYIAFSKQSLWTYWPKKVVHLTNWGTKKTNVNRMLLIDIFLPATYLPIDNLLGDFKIQLILSFKVSRYIIIYHYRK